jgi:hypothetical protein
VPEGQETPSTESQKHRWLYQPYFPLLLCIYPVALLFSTNMHTTTLNVAFWPMLLALGTTASLYGLLRLGLRSWPVAAMITSLALFLFFSYGHLYAGIYRHLLHYDVDVGSRHYMVMIWDLVVCKTLLVAWIAIFVFGWRRIRRMKPKSLRTGTYALNLFSSLLIALPLGVIGFNYASGNYQKTVEKKSTVSSAKSAVVKKLGYAPDIYYIVVDGYARQDVLKKGYNYDNSWFLDGLRQRKFTVANRSHANYIWTFLSLTSTLNMEHLTYFTEKLGASSTDMGVPYQMLRNNKVATFLRQQGYKIVHINSTWGATMLNPHADVELSCDEGIFQEEFYRVLAEGTLLKNWETSVDQDLAACHLQNAKKLGELAKKPGPKFVFHHFVPPHHPYLFDENGKVLRHATVSNQFEFQKLLWGKRDKYVQQLAFVSKLMLGVADEILGQSKQSPIVIIHSDHGPQLIGEKGRFEKNWVINRMRNMVAVHAPESPASLIPDDLTMVNLFPLILNHYFDAKIPLKANDLWFSGIQSPYKFQPVNSR